MILRPVHIGDALEVVFSSLGITKRRVSVLFSKSRDCGCSARQSALNAWGYRVQYKIIMFVGGPSDMSWGERLAVVQGRLYRLWKTTTSK